MADDKAFSWKHFLIEGVMLAVFGFFLNERLESHKKQLADNTESLKSILQANSPFVEQRRIAYNSILESARQLTRMLKAYYANTQPEGEDLLKRKLSDVETAWKLTGGFSSDSYWGPSKSEARDVVRDFINIRNKYADVCSETVIQHVDAFANSVLDDLKRSVQERDTAKSHTVARQHLLTAFGNLDKTINEALGISQLPIK